MAEIKIPKIALDAGHGLYTIGKWCLKALDPNQTREWVLNDRIIDKVEKKLANYICEVLRLDDTTGIKDVSLAQRVKKANDWGADIVISEHHDGGANGGYAGGVTVRYGTKNATRVAQANRLYKAIVDRNGLVGNRASKVLFQNLYLLKNTKMAALLIENGFMDSKIDVPIILTEEHAEKTAQGIVDFLVAEYDLKEKVAEKKKNIEQIAKEVIDGKWGNGAERKRALEKSGYDYAEVQNMVNALAKGTVATSIYYPKYNGVSAQIDTVFKTIGVPEQYRGKWNKRKPIAKANGIANYVGLGTQNAKLIALAKQGKLVKA